MAGVIRDFKDLDIRHVVSNHAPKCATALRFPSPLGEGPVEEIKNGSTNSAATNISSSRGRIALKNGDWSLTLSPPVTGLRVSNFEIRPSSSKRRNEGGDLVS